MMQSSARQGYAPVPGGSLYYETSGQGEPIVLIHGFSLDTRSWDAQVPALSRDHRVIRYDLRGFGRSPYTTEPYTHAEDLFYLLSHLGVEQAVLVGLSMGGGAAINFTLLYPERVRALVLVDATLGGFPWSAEASEFGARLHLLARAEGMETARDYWLSSPLFGPAMRRPEVAGALRAMVHDYSGVHWLRADPGVPLDPPAIERLHQLRVPTLVIVGEQDTGDFQAIAARLEQGIPGSRKTVVPGVGHMASMEAPERVNDLILGFLPEPPGLVSPTPG